MKKRVLSLIMILTLITALFAGCGKNNAVDTGKGTDNTKAAEKTFNGVDISKPVTLKMYLLGERTADFDKVYAEINKRLQEKLNATVEVEFLSWSEHDKKYSLL